ncbi:MAG: prepilin-type N-terminal cleavage/methylation domain-containing protein [Candidatus Nealsonbacteria bacterium]|nr:MAG: prepilin-type N-terminal cleavage/methylation domain-containing protein [Candidatus Nealsonbacteria bacterium]
MLYYSSMLGFFTKKRGLTLIEFLVALAVIGLLISVIVVSFSSPRKEAKDAKRQTDIKQIMKAMDLCYDDSNCGAGVNQYPTNDTADKANAIENIDKDKNPYYLCPVPKDPSDSGDQMYKWSKNDTIPAKYCLYVKLQTEDIWIAASEKGTKFDLTTKPPTTLSSTVSCW